MAILDREAVRSLVDTALNAGRCDSMVVGVGCSREGATRYANNAITQSVVRDDAELWVEAAFGDQVGVCATNSFEPDSIVDCVRRAEAIARVRPPDPEHMPPLPPSTVAPVQAHAEATARSTPEARGDLVARAVATVQRAGLSAAGVLSVVERAQAIGNSRGLFLDHRETSYALSCSATASDSVGWAQATGRDLASVNAEVLAQRAVDKALAGRSPQLLEPGTYEVVLEPAATAELVAYLYWMQLDARACDEGRSFFSGKLGQPLASKLVQLYSDPTDPLSPCAPFGEDGLTLRRQEWLRDGVLTQLRYSRYWAKKQGVEPTGWLGNFNMGGGASSLERMIQNTRRGLLVTRFWYIRVVEQMQDLYTGMTRDGTFLIEDGAIRGPVKNLRFNDSAVRLLASVEELGPQECAYDPTLLFPSLRAREFTFTGTTEF